MAGPKKRGKKSATERILTTAAARSRAAWAQRHPQRAAAERALRKARAEILDRWGHKRGGTPETLEQAHRPGAIARLHLSGAISDDQLAWATEIFAVAEALARDVGVTIARYDMRVDGGGRARGDGERLGWIWMEAAYSRWRAQCWPVAAALALDMIVRDRPLTIAARAHSMSARRARRELTDALDLWDACYRAVRREIDAGAVEDALAAI